MTKIKDYIRGTTRIIKLNFFQPDGTTPLDLTGGKVSYALTTSQDPDATTTPSLLKTVTVHTVPSGVPSSSGFTAGQDTAAQGISWVKIVPADTQSLSAGTYHHAYQAVTAAGDVIEAPSDQFIINPDIIRTNS